MGNMEDGMDGVMDMNISIFQARKKRLTDWRTFEFGVGGFTLVIHGMGTRSSSTVITHHQQARYCIRGQPLQWIRRVSFMALNLGVNCFGGSKS
jgi:hypothetical protein